MLISPEGTNSLQGKSSKEDLLNTQTSLGETSFPMKVGQVPDQPNTQTDAPTNIIIHELKPELTLLRRIETITKQMDTTPRNHKKVQAKPLQQPPFFVAVYRSYPLDPLPILPPPTWKNSYTHVKSKVNSIRTS